VWKKKVVEAYIREKKLRSSTKNLYPSIFRVIGDLKDMGLVKEEKKEHWGRIPYSLTASGFVAALGALHLLDEKFPTITEDLAQTVKDLLKANSTFFPFIAKKWSSLTSIDRETPTHVLLYMGLLYLLQMKESERTEVELYRRIRKKARTPDSTPKNWFIPKKLEMTEERFVNEVTSCFFEGRDVITKRPFLITEEYDRWLEIQSRDKELAEILLERLAREKKEILREYEELEARLQGKMKPWFKTSGVR